MKEENVGIPPPEEEDLQEKELFFNLETGRIEIRKRASKSGVPTPIIIEPTGFYGFPQVQEIIEAVAAAATTLGGAKMSLEVVKLWLDYKKGKRIKIRKGDLEIEIQGDMTQREIEGQIARFRELTRDLSDKPEIVIRDR
jgi:DNA repair photolyase